MVQDFQVAYKRKKAVVSPSVEAGGFAFQLESAHVYVQSIEVKESFEESPSLSSTLLCARLADLQDEFTAKQYQHALLQ